MSSDMKLRISEYVTGFQERWLSLAILQILSLEYNWAQLRGTTDQFNPEKLLIDTNWLLSTGCGNAITPEVATLSTFSSKNQS
jgi:hypothetical protein